MSNNDLMRPILADPADDGCRLVFADWLDENGEPERAEFIRVQIELASMKIPQGLDRDAPFGLFGERERRFKKWGQNSKWGKRRDALRRRESELYVNHFREWFVEFRDLCVPSGDDPRYGYISRGFPSAIACTMERFMGGKCERCEGRGTIPYMMPEGILIPKCQYCHGTGRVPGLIVTIFSQWPVTEVRLTDREPWYEHGYGGEYCWWRESEWYSLSNDQTGNITDELFDKIAELHPDNRLSWGGPAHNQHIGFDSRDAALLALSHAIVDLGRERAGLPAITWSK